MKIRLYEHPFAPAAPREFEADSLAEWLLDHYGDSPQVGVQIYAGEPSGRTELTTAEAILAAKDGEYVVLQSPGAAAVPYLIKAVIMVAVNAIVSLLVAPRKPPSNVNRTQQSPNNALAARENQVRLQERVEDIFGTVKSVPSLMMPTYHKYIENNRVEYGYYCVGRGYYQISEIRDGESLISAISGASAAVYEPFTSPNSGHAPAIQIGEPIIDDILTVARSVEVDGITLLHQNQITLPANAGYTFVPDPNGDYITQDEKNPNFNSLAEPGQMVQIFIEDGPRRRTATGTVTFDASNNRITDDAGSGIFAGLLPGAKFNVSGSSVNGGVYTVFEAVGLNSIRTVEAVSSSVDSGVSVTVAMDFPTSWTGQREIASVWDGGITLVGSLWGGGEFSLPASITIDNHLQDWTDWFTLSAPDRTEVWANIVAPQGMYRDDGGKSASSVSFELQVERLDPETLNSTGHIETSIGTVSGSTTAERGQTVEHVTSWTGPARVRVRRTTPFDFDFDGVVVDEIKFNDLYAVSPIGPQHFGNKTTIHTVTRSTPRATSFRQRQLNCMSTRRLPIFDGSALSGSFDVEGRHVSGTIAPTERMVDILAAVCVDPKIGARDLAGEVDMAQIWGVQQALDAWNPECSRFSYTFDSDELSFEETVQVIANACFCQAYRQNGRIRLALDRPQAASAALFTHRNKRPSRDRAETISRTFPTAAEYDGVEFVYIDEDSHTAESFTLPLAGAQKAKKFEIPGIRSFTQAWLRAQREYAKLVGQRVTIETDVTTDARLLLPYTRVDIVDNTRFRSYDGEVVGQQGLQLTLSQPVRFTPGHPHSIVLMRRDGTLQSIACTPGADEHTVILAAPPAEPIVTEFGADGVRTIYSFAADTARAAQAFLVHEIGVSDGQFIKITGVNYSDGYYSADTAPIPDKASILS